MSGLLDEMGGRDEMKLIGGFALPLPVRVISDLLVVLSMTGLVSSGGRRAVSRSRSPRTVSLRVDRLDGFLHFIGALVWQRWDEPRDDIMDALLLVRDENEVLSDDELLSMVVLLVSRITERRPTS